MIIADDMANSPPYLDEKPLILFYKNKDYPQRAKGISFFVLIFSIVIYISIFYIFNLSPSLNNTMLWFFVSNTLILIIAADYGVFSSSSRAKNDVCDEYLVMRSQLRSTVSSFVSQYPQVVKKSDPDEEAVEYNLPEDKKEAINGLNDDQYPDDKVVIFVKSEAESNSNVDNSPEKMLESYKKVDNDNNNKNDAVGTNEKKLKETNTYRRSRSEKTKRVVIDESENNIRKSASESSREEEGDEEDDEYSTMSDEELQRRIEEFIQRFNRQIRLQRAGKFHQI